MPYYDEGAYRASISAAALGRVRTGTAQVELTLELLGRLTSQGEEEARQGQYPPVAYLTLTAETMGTLTQPGWVAETLKYLGFDGDFDNLDQLVGREVKALCRYEARQDGNGEREKWSILRPREA